MFVNSQCAFLILFYFFRDNAPFYIPCTQSVFWELSDTPLPSGAGEDTVIHSVYFSKLSWFRCQGIMTSVCVCICLCLRLGWCADTFWGRKSRYKERRAIAHPRR